MWNKSGNDRKATCWSRHQAMWSRNRNRSTMFACSILCKVPAMMDQKLKITRRRIGNPLVCYKIVTHLVYNSIFVQFTCITLWLQHGVIFIHSCVNSNHLAGSHVTTTLHFTFSLSVAHCHWSENDGSHFVSFLLIDQFRGSLFVHYLLLLSFHR